jgi:T5orf172 domain
MAPQVVRRRPDVLALLDPARAAHRRVHGGKPPNIIPHRPGAVYLLPHIGRARFKVGWSLHPLERVQRLPEYLARELDLGSADVAWFEQAPRACEVERALHRSLAPYRVQPGHLGDGRTEWFAIQGLVLARRMLDVLPAADGASRRARLQPLLGAPEAPEANFTTPIAQSALDTWYRVEDLWSRLNRLLPLALHTDRERRHLHWIGLRRLTDIGHLVLRSRVVDIETYGWREYEGRRTLVTLMDWEGDDLLLQLMPSRTLRRWAEGDFVDQSLEAFIAGHALSPSLARALWEAFPAGDQR